MEDFESVEINVNEFSVNWGPFIFLIPSATTETAEDGLIPFGTEIASTIVRAFIGSVSPGTDVDSLQEITTQLLDTAPVVEADKIRVRLTYPGDAFVGKNVTLAFICTLDDATEHAFYSQSISIQ